MFIQAPQELVSEVNLPNASYIINRSAYSLVYDPRTRNPIYVYEKLDSSCLKGRITRDKCSFKEDMLIPEIFRNTLKDYSKSGFDRGHLAPAANHKQNTEVINDTFFLTNMCPQHPQLNRGYWKRLEKYVRDLTQVYDSIEVFTGPLYLPVHDENGKKWVTYQVIGDNNIAVPTHFYKIILIHEQEQSFIKAYVLPNENIPSGISLNTFETSVEKVEKAAGVCFSK